MHRNEPKENVADEITIKQIDAWEFSVSRSKKRLYIDTTSYHPIKLGLTRDDLQELLDSMDDVVKTKKKIWKKEKN